MSFVSVFFLALFFTTLAARWIFRNSKNRNYYLFFLLGMSLLFYVSYIPKYIFVLLGLTAIDFYMGRRIAQTNKSKLKKLFLAISIVSNLGILCFYRYYHCIIENVRFWGYFFDHPLLTKVKAEIAIPLGISFFTFQSISYTVDVYRGLIRPERYYWKFLLFVSFFTHLVSGPIVRAKELIYQFNRKRRFWLGPLLQGGYLMVRGYFLKRVVADNLAVYVNNYWNDEFIAGNHNLTTLALACLFGCQIYADFEGYTSIARGSAYLLGFRLPNNFNHPYLASSFREFWNRWHITLSHWMRDYLYVPLGGNRCSRPRLYLNLLLVMALAGMWHGAAFTFLAWGILHGMALVTERILGLHQPEKRNRWLSGFWYVVVQGVVLIAWIYFRSENIQQANAMIGSIFKTGWDLNPGGHFLSGLALIIPVMAIHLRGLLDEKNILAAPGLKEKAFWGALMVFAILSLSGSPNAFIYFRF